MSEHINSDKELFFQNTPLQNLKNILSDADAFMGSRMSNSLEQPILFERKGISKSALQEALNDLLGTSGQYISSAAVSRILCKLCAEENGENISKIEDFNSNISIKKLKNITKMI
jgi:hypothetical protein